MKERFDVYFAGQILDGNDPNSVRNKLAKLFNADEPTLDLLFSGKAYLIKRDCDQDTALKYKRAIEQAGASPLIKATGAAAIAEKQPTPSATAAQKIAALAAAPEEHGYQQTEAGASTPKKISESVGGPEGIELSPEGTEVLCEAERAEPVIREIDTTGLEVDTKATRLSQESSPPPAMLDTGHLSLADAGETIPNLPPASAPLSPNLEGLTLTEPGTDLSDCSRDEAEAPEMYLSALTLELPGADILEEQYRKAEPGAAPSTDHLSLEN